MHTVTGWCILFLLLYKIELLPQKKYFKFPRIAGISCIFLADVLVSRRIHRIRRKHLLRSCLPFGTFCTLPLSQGKYRLRRGRGMSQKDEHRRCGGGM